MTMTDSACLHWRARIVALADTPLGWAGDASLTRHLAVCTDCRTYAAAVRCPAEELDRLVPPIPPPARVWRRIRRAIAGPSRARRLAPVLAAAVASLSLGLWGGAAAMTRAAEHSDETTLMAAVWSTHRGVTAWRVAGVADGAWPLSVHGAALVCRLRDGRWMVSVLVHNVPAGEGVREEVVAGARRLSRTLVPLHDTVLDVAVLPAEDAPVRWVGLWQGGARTPGGLTLTAWRVGALLPLTPGGRPSPPPAWRT